MKGKERSKNIVKAALTIVLLCGVGTGGQAVREQERRQVSNNRTLRKQSQRDEFDDFRPVEKTFRKIVAELGNQIEIPCSIAQSCPHNVEWYKQHPNGKGKKRITQFRNRYELSSMGTMKLQFSTFEDAGTFVCKVANMSALHFVQLVVPDNGITSKNNHLKPSPKRKKKGNDNNEEDTYSEPHIHKNQLPTEKISVKKGEPTLLLKCESSGNPQPEIKWYKNEEILISSTSNVATLKLLNVSQADNGQYKCESVNLFGISKYEVTIQITDYRFGAAEILSLNPRNVTVVTGGLVNITCVAKFQQDPWFAWVRKVPNDNTDNGNTFFHPGTGSYYEVLRNTAMKFKGDGVFSTELLMNNLRINDSGEYICAVAGLQGYNLSAATIIVEPGTSQLFLLGSRGVAAQWAILLTISFVILVMFVILCFVKLYSCRPAKPSKSSKSQVPMSMPHCSLPESSPLTMSTQCTTAATQASNSVLPLMVGSCSRLAESDYKASSNPSYNYPHSQTLSWDSSSFYGESNCHFNSSRSYRPNSMCSEYQCRSIVSRPQVHYDQVISLSNPQRQQQKFYHQEGSSFFYYKNYNDNHNHSSICTESCDYENGDDEIIYHSKLNFDWRH